MSVHLASLPSHPPRCYTLSVHLASLSPIPRCYTVSTTPCQYTWLRCPPIPQGATPCQLHHVSTPGFAALPSPKVLHRVNYTVSVHLALLPSHPPRCYTLSTTPCQYTWLCCPPIPPGATPCQLHLVSTPGFAALPSPQVLHRVNYTLSVHLALLPSHPPRCYTLSTTPCQYTWLHCPPIPPGATPCQLHLVSTPGFTVPPQAQEACGYLELESAIDQLAGLDRELDDTKQSAMSGRLHPLPGETAESAATLLGTTSKTVGSSMAQLLTAAAQGNEDYVGIAARDTANAMKVRLRTSVGQSSQSVF